MKKYIKLIRVKHYIKNLLIFLPIIFSQRITDITALTKTLITFILFCISTSIIYVVNDIKDKYTTDLFLAGHSHNNSINIPFLKSPYKIDGALTYNEEYYEIDNSKLYVSGGIGTNGYGIRLFCHPSFNFFRLATEE